MCIAGGKNAVTPTPTPLPVAPAPTTASVTAAATNDNSTAIAEAKRALSMRQGVFGNIRTSVNGDPGFGTSSMSGGYATFGSIKRAA
jgi:hypothetical protein